MDDYLTFDEWKSNYIESHQRKGLMGYCWEWLDHGSRAGCSFKHTYPRDWTAARQLQHKQVAATADDNLDSYAAGGGGGEHADEKIGKKADHQGSPDKHKRKRDEDSVKTEGAAGGSSALVNTTPAKAPRAAAAAASPFSPKVPVMLDDILDEDSELLSFLTLGECSGETYAVRVTSKTPRREYSTSGGGEVFSFNIVDRAGTQMKVTCFNEAVEAFFDEIEVGCCYSIAEFTVKPANKSYNTLPSPYEIILQEESEVVMIDDGAVAESYNFKRLSAVKTGTTADVIGIIQDVDTLKRVGGGTYAKRTITLVDGKNGRLTVVLWREQAEDEGATILKAFKASKAAKRPLILACKKGVGKEWNGNVELTFNAGTTFELDPRVPQAAALRALHAAQQQAAAAS